MKSIQHLKNISVNDEWETPNIILKKAMMDFDVLPFLDVCATEQNAKFSSYFTESNDALSQKWIYPFFMNPPYSKVYDFLKHGYEQHKKYNIDGLVLIYSKTDTKYWHEFIENKAETHFIKGRIKFEKKGIPSKSSSPYPSVWVIWRKI